MATNLHLPFIHLPHYYTKLLMSNSHSNPDFFYQTIQYIYNTPVLNGLVRSFVVDGNSRIPADAQIKAMGWLGLRDRLAMVFLERENCGRFCLATDQTHSVLAEILEFEQRTRDISVEGHSRSFQLAFYLKMIQLRSGTESPTGENLFGIIPRPLLQMLLEAKARAIRIDWLFLFCLHMYQYRGPEKFKQLIANSGSKQNLQGIDFMHVWPVDETDLTKEITLNLLRYGTSIGEQDFFSSSLVGGTQRSREGDANNTR